MMNLLGSAVGNYVISGGKKYSYFGGNNYLCLADHPAVKEAAIRAIEKYGASFSASRRTTGTADLHLELEKSLARFKGSDDAVVFASGYLGNGILLETLKDTFSAVFADSSAHPSITGSIPQPVRRISYYNHCDTGHLEELLSAPGVKDPLIITDGIFALTGELAPLGRIAELAGKYKAVLVTDDAHATGVLGATGKGTPEHFGIHGRQGIYQTETMSKALGSFGGFIAGSSELTEQIRESSRVYQASTALPPAVAAAGIAALGVLGNNPQLRTRLIDKAGEMRKQISLLGFRTLGDLTPIIPLVSGSSENSKRLSAFLEENGIIVPFMNYPGTEGRFLLRIAVCAGHTEEQITLLLEKLDKWKKNHGTD